MDASKAAQQNDAAAQSKLGWMYFKGQGVPLDYAEAMKWWRMAAEQGYALAQFHLGAMYANGQGVPKDYVQAYKWLNLAGDEKSREIRDALASLMTPEQIAEAQKLSREFQAQ